jgi:uncharacterized protein YukE
VNGQLNILGPSRPLFAGLLDAFALQIHDGVNAALQTLNNDVLNRVRLAPSSLDAFQSLAASTVAAIDSRLGTMIANITGLAVATQQQLALLVNAAVTDIHALIDSYGNPLKAAAVAASGNDLALQAAVRSIVDSEVAALKADLTNDFGGIVNIVLNAIIAAATDGTGLAGFLTITSATGPLFTLAGPGFSFSGTGRLDINTTGSATVVNGRTLQPGGRVHVDGTLTVGGATFSGAFDFTTGVRNGNPYLAVRVDATRSVVFQGTTVLSLDLDGGLEISVQGLGGRIATAFSR